MKNGKQGILCYNQTHLLKSYHIIQVRIIIISNSGIEAYFFLTVSVAYTDRQNKHHAYNYYE